MRVLVVRQTSNFIHRGMAHDSRELKHRKWRRRELHPRPGFRKRKSRIVVTPEPILPVCILPALIWLCASWSRAGTAWRRMSGRESSNWPVAVKPPWSSTSSTTRPFATILPSKWLQGKFPTRKSRWRHPLHPAAWRIASNAKRSSRSPRSWSTSSSPHRPSHQNISRSISMRPAAEPAIVSGITPSRSTRATRPRS